MGNRRGNYGVHEMIHAQIIPRVDREQIINGEYIDLVWRTIKREIDRGFSCAFVGKATKAEKQYMKLYGYTPKDVSNETMIYW
jgi:hypothetical protein